MHPFPRSLILLSVLAVIIAFSGCTGLDPTAIATSNSMIKQFMNEHPNAQIKVTHFTAAQSKNIIDQIRQDCDNPYLDEKDYYRVNVTDPDTNFYATIWIDWNNRTVECVFKIGTEGKVIEKPKVDPACESHSYYKCYSNHIYWFDSCGNKQDKKEYCQYGCTEKECRGECNSHAEYRCYGDHVYWFDSCGNKQDKKEYCNYGCDNGFCKQMPSEMTCGRAGGYCIWPSYTTEASAAGGGAGAPTGMVITSTEATSASTASTTVIVNYQCKEGYEASPNYFCNEGGVCCVPKEEPVAFCGTSTYGSCTSDSGCITSGCSGQICQSVKEEPAITTCEYKDCYNAAKYGMACKCIIDTVTPSATAAIIGESVTQGKCKWVKAETGYCTDSDGGKNYYVRGTAYTSSQELTDHCNDDGTLTEKYCSGNQISAEVYQCPFGCLEGACIQQQACMDSDGGNNYYTKGTVKTEASGFCPNGCTDYCEGVAVVEYSCNGAFSFTCPYGCSNGTCIQQPSNQTCTDSDGGLNYYVKGTATGTWAATPEGPVAAQTDFCYNSTLLQEISCVNADPTNPNSHIGIGQSGYDCPYGCSDGACIQQTQTCTDSDGGKNYYVKGTTAGLNINNQTEISYDKCWDIDGQTLLEYYCDGNKIGWESSLKCDYGCSQGACLSSVPICNDSDSQDSLYVKGYATIDNGITKIYDKCGYEQGYQSTNMLIEAYCDGYKLRVKYPECPYGCSDGACLQQNCSNECPTYGTSECISPSEYKICGNYDMDSCNEWSQTYNCPLYGCSNGVCIDQAQTCYENQPCVLIEGRSASVNTGGTTRMIKNTGVSSVSTAVISVNSISKEVTEQGTYYIDGIEVYVNSVFYSQNFSLRQISLTVKPPQTCSLNQTCTVNEGQTATVTTPSAGNYTVMVVGVSSTTTAVLSVNGVNKDVTETNSYLIAGRNFYISAVYYFTTVGSSKVSFIAF